jgi:alpha-tubulin suppressor-like RCC1 family protein
VWAWGNNFRGQLGTGNTSSQKTPVQVPGFTGVTSVVAGTSYSLAIRGDGSAWGWGYNDAFQLGDGVLSLRSLSPVQVKGLMDVAAVGAGERRSLALKSDGTVWVWGSNEKDALGDGWSISRALPGTISQP